MTKIISVVNQKGGVGKTTTAVNLATALAALRKRVLLVDLDPQGNATTSLGISHDDRFPGIYEFLMGIYPAEIIYRHSFIPNLFIVPSSPDLAGAEVELVSLTQREYQLSNKIHSLVFDYIFIDCPPSLGLLTLNALSASHTVLIPLQCEYFALEGLSQLVKTVQIVKKLYNPTLAIQGILLTMFDKRNSFNQCVIEDVQKNMGSLVYETIIPRNIKISEAPSHGKPVLIYDVKSTGAQSYIRLASEFLHKEEGHSHAA